ncbi:unnamed protein product [Cuscuta epithymum]|uniref:BAH domain-containing protein n=1 Tax=Cuscuta epithymum TaxID=186058 RepID=A0AAV0EDS4_9ASTE|nr:unnamed protein product [Cuscuta epithymum]
MTSSTGAALQDTPKSTSKLDICEGLEFLWGKKRGVGGKRKEVQFYESFTYDGIGYALYDCVYMHKEGEPEPYIGKLIKIWENADRSKKIKLQWFFRPSEILNYLKDETFMGNEIFLASGEGHGLSNVNPLEAIAGKCNVVCISEDKRNRQPSEEELKAADYIFYRVFDVAKLTMDQIGDSDIVGGLEVKFVFNRNESEKAHEVLKIASDCDEDSNATVQYNMQNSSNGLDIEKGNANSSSLVLRNNEPEEVRGDGIVLSSELDLTTEVKFTAMQQIKDNKVANGIILQEDISANKTVNKITDNDTKHIRSSGTSDSGASNRVKHDSAMPLEYKDPKSNKRSSMNDAKPQVGGVTSSEHTEKADNVKNHCELGKEMKPGKDSNLDLDRPWKKAKIDFSATISGDKIKSDVPESNCRSGENEDKVITKTLNSSQKKISRTSKISDGLDNNSNSEIPCPDGAKSLVKSTIAAAAKTKTKPGQVGQLYEMAKEDKSGKDSIIVGDGASKKANVGISDKILMDGKYNSQRTSNKQGEKDGNVLLKPTNSFKERAMHPKATHGLDEGLPTVKSSMKLNKLSSSNISSLGGASTNAIKDLNNKSIEVAPKAKSSMKPNKLSNINTSRLGGASNAIEKLHDNGIEVTPRHDESVTWFKELSWEERMQTANDQGTLVLLQNLDPGFISAEVEDIIWHAFKEKCSAKIIQHTAFSNPNTGQALAIFKTREAAERVKRTLDNKYLMVSDQRPLVADIIAIPKFQRSTSSFVGHLVIEKVRHQMQREMREAVSTSHCSQPNTIEYEMAMEWRLRQCRSEFCWKKLHNQQKKEFERVIANLKAD